MMASTMLGGFDVSYMIDEWHYDQRALNMVGEDAAKNISYYVNTGREPSMYDYKYDNEYVPIVLTTQALPAESTEEKEQEVKTEEAENEEITDENFEDITYEDEIYQDEEVLEDEEDEQYDEMIDAQDEEEYIEEDDETIKSEEKNEDSLIKFDNKLLEKNFKKVNLKFFNNTLNYDFYIINLEDNACYDLNIIYNGFIMPVIYPFMGYSNDKFRNTAYPNMIFGKIRGEHNNFFVYGILGSPNKESQPFLGSTGFIYFERLKNEDIGYWIMFISESTGKISIPLKPKS